MFLEELGSLFRNDPTFDFIFNNLPKSQFVRIVELRRKRMSSEPPSINDLI